MEAASPRATLEAASWSLCDPFHIPALQKFSFLNNGLLIADYLKQSAAVIPPNGGTSNCFSSEESLSFLLSSSDSILVQRRLAYRLLPAIYPWL